LNWCKLHPELFLTGNESGLSFEVYTHGGRNPTSINVLHWAKLMETYGAGEILLTSMDCDGTKNGYDLKLNRTISESLTIPLIASGGAGTLDHLFEGITEGKADAVLAASIFHFKEFTIEETKRYLKSKGIPVRI
jgi:cyclase